MASTADGSRRRRRHALIVGLIIVFSAVYAAGILLYFSAQRGPALFVKNQGASPSQIDALVRTTSIDPNRNDLELRIEVRPGPGLVGDDGVSVTRPVSIDIVGGTGTASKRYAPGDRISPFDVTIGTTGNINSYPFDTYQSVFILLVVAAPPPEASGQPGTAATTPTRFAFDGTLSGYRITGRPIPHENAEANTLALGLSIRRAPLTATFATLILALQVLLAVAAAALAVFVWRVRRAEIPMLTWLTAMLFAIVPLRNAMPGAPPIGALVDVVVFFWAVTIIAVSMAAVLWVWMRRSAPAA